MIAAVLTTQQAADLYTALTGDRVSNPYLVSEGMRRRGYPIARDPNGRLQIKAADVRAYAQDKLERPRLPSPGPSTTPKGVLTPAKARILYNKLTGQNIANPGTIVTGMERRGFPVRRNRRGRITMTEADVRAYAADKLARPRLRKTGKGITLKPPTSSDNGRTRRTYEAIARIAVNQGYEPIQRQGYVELVRSPRFKAIEPQFIDVDFSKGVQTSW